VIKEDFKKSKYIYGIIATQNSSNVFSSEDLFLKENGVYAITYDGYTAVVSDSSIVDYNIKDREFLARLLIKHQEIIEKIMSLKVEVIPVKLGTWALDSDEISDILNKGHIIIENIMEKIKNKIEIDVAATWGDFNTVLKEIGEKDEIRSLRESILANSKEINSDHQMMIGMAVKKELDRKTTEYVLNIQKYFEGYWANSRSHELMDDKMIINTAFLIDEDKQSDFDKKINEMDKKFGGKLNFRCIGPLPPYSFYTIEIMKIKFEDLDWARRKLGLLNNSVSKNEIIYSYKKLVLVLHPDKNPDKPDIENEFNEVIKAYKILNDYCEACEQTNHGNSFCFDEEKFKKNATLVKLRD